MGSLPTDQKLGTEQHTGMSGFLRSHWPNDLTMRGRTQERSCIHLNEEHEVQYWMGSMGISREQLVVAVTEVGSSPDKIREYLHISRANTVPALLELVIWLGN